MIALITAALPVIFKLLEAVIDSSKEKKRLQKSFVNFLEEMQKDEPRSPRLRKSYQDQIARLKKKAEEDGAFD
jgi:hypothetical protein